MLTNSYRWCAIILLFGICAGCQSGPSATVGAGPEKPVDSEEAARTSTFDVVVPAPDGSTASLVVRRDGQAGYERHPTRVRSGDREELVPLGERRTISIAASTEQLQRIRIDGFDYLVEVAPGEELILWDNPCNGWQLTVPRGDAQGARTSDVRCKSQAKACPDGFSPNPLPRVADDPICTPEQRRCVRVTTVTLVGSGIEVDGEPVADGETIERGPTLCDFSEVRAGDDRVGLMPPIGSRWRIEVRDGKLVGFATHVAEKKPRLH